MYLILSLCVTFIFILINPLSQLMPNYELLSRPREHFGFRAGLDDHVQF